MFHQINKNIQNIINEKKDKIKIIAEIDQT